MVSPCNKKKFMRGKLLFSKEERKTLKTKLSYKPLIHKRFYLDVINYKALDNLKRDLCHLGGIVEEFLVKEINYVITNRNLNHTLKRDSSSESLPQATPSPQYPNSPSTPQLPSSVYSNSWDSPNPDSSKEENKKKTRTRAEVFLERACLRKQGTSDILENARLWSIPVWSLSKLLTWLEGLKESPLYQPPKPVTSQKKDIGTPSVKRHSESSSSHSKYQKLKEPFIKVESFKRDFRPHFKELQRWPALSFISSQGLSPFAECKPSKQEKDPSSKHKDIYLERQRATNANNIHSVKTKGGYCELCSTNYPDLKLHLQAESHLAFVRDKTNYDDIDELIRNYDLSKLMQ